MKWKGSAGPRVLTRTLLMAAGLVMAPSLVRPASAQATQPDPGPLPQARASGVLIPPAHVDPGMTRPIPDMPAQSMPVIHPRQLRKTRHGTVQVVPK